MPTVAFHTLGCKVNQYDTQAMQELFTASGYQTVPFTGDADIYLINTCTVTGTGDRKSLQLARRIRREHPDSILILCGCMAQKKAEELLSTGADLILGTQNRSSVVTLTEEVIRRGQPVCAVAPLGEKPDFEKMNISLFEGHTRAVLKIQEGCSNRCSYCIIPSVRGPIRSRPLQEIRRETERLRDAGFVEIVLTGIHLASYGKDFPESGITLLDAIRTVHEVDGIHRIRLGSLEPLIAGDSFCDGLKSLPKVCPQFHLALQSGSDTVLARMRRRYNTGMYLEAVDHIRKRYPDAALTTDILTGFPGETAEEYEETRKMIERVGFSRIHVFPYSPREGTPAAAMPGQLSSAEKERRARELIRLGNTVAEKYLRSWIGRDTFLLPEEMVNGRWEGYTPEYIRVSMDPSAVCHSGVPCRIKLASLSSCGIMNGIINEIQKG